jgi:hypothetical protein
MERCDPNEKAFVQGIAFYDGGGSGAGDGACGEFRLLDVFIHPASAGCAGETVGVRAIIDHEHILIEVLFAEFSICNFENHAL